MENIGVLIMEKNPETGYLNKELGSYTMQCDINLIDRIFAVREGAESIVYIYMTALGEFEDWEFNAILDNYDWGLYDGKVLSIEEDEESYNPAWLVKLPFVENDSAMEEKLNEVLKIHEGELKRVESILKELENEYKEEGTNK